MSESKLNKQLIDKILGYVESGAYISKVFKKADIDIAPGTFYTWMRESDWLKGAYEDACKVGMEVRLDTIEERIDYAETDLEFRKSLEVGKHRRWHAKALNREKYGDNQKVTHDGSVDSVINVIVPDTVE